MATSTQNQPTGSAIGTLVSLFKAQLEKECAKLGAALGTSNRGTHLLWWYLREIQELSDPEIEEANCDGGGDLGLDAIHIDDDKLVHFYQFKNPEAAEKAVQEGEIDKLISGLGMILRQDHASIANEQLKGRIQDIYDTVPSGYRVHIISSGAGIPPGSAAEQKLKSFVAELSVPSETFIQWDAASIKDLQDRYYIKTLPVVKDPITLEVPSTPYMVKSGNAECYFLHTSGKVLAELFETHGNGLLQRNIRVSQGKTQTNRSIEATCKGEESLNFLHYNNGITFLCDTATFDGFKHTLRLNRAQVVNGGQTIRALHRVFTDGSLRPDVLVPLRIITSNGDKDFGSNVAVNQNNQNQMRTGFLRSNDPRVIQLASALAANGWYLERREGEATSLSPEERESIENRLGKPLGTNIIKLKEGAQAYVATFFRHPELAGL